MSSRRAIHRATATKADPNSRRIYSSRSRRKPNCSPAVGARGLTGPAGPQGPPGPPGQCSASDCTLSEATTQNVGFFVALSGSTFSQLERIGVHNKPFLFAE